MKWGALVNSAILILATLTGIAAFVYPFFTPTTSGGQFAMAHAQDAPSVTLILTLLCVVIIVANL
ncbi:MAG: hypothetical protein H5T63_07830, partial [Chloroflexi bacterium]|nr:hypothetical protein [Chloroflexota bacterium]